MTLSVRRSNSSGRLRVAAAARPAQLWPKSSTAAQADPFVIAPRLDVLEAKANELMDAELARRSRLLPHYANYVAPDAPLHLELIWQDGALVESRCRCVSAEVGRMSRSDEVSRLPDEYLDMLAEATGIDWLPDHPENAIEVRRERVRRVLREIAREDAARERGLHPKRRRPGDPSR